MLFFVIIVTGDDFMNATMISEDLAEISSEVNEKYFIELSYDNIKNISREIMEQNREAYTTLANA